MPHTNSLVAPDALGAHPTRGSGATSMKRVSFFRVLQTKAYMGNLAGVKASVDIISNAGMRFTYRLWLPLLLNVNTTTKLASNSIPDVIRTAVVNAVNRFLGVQGIPSQNSILSGAITSAAGGEQLGAHGEQ